MKSTPPFNVDELVRIYLKPPYLTTKTGVPIIPSVSLITIFVRGELYKEYYGTTGGEALWGVKLNLFNIRALARNKGAKSEIFIETADMTPEYEYAMNPHPTYAY
jgi:hypothetical protein